MSAGVLLALILLSKFELLKITSFLIETKLFSIFLELFLANALASYQNIVRAPWVLRYRIYIFYPVCKKFVYGYYIVLKI